MNSINSADWRKPLKRLVALASHDRDLGDSNQF